MRSARTTNAVLALVTEIALLAACVTIGLRLPAALPLQVAVAILLPLLVAAVWAMGLAPQARRRLPAGGRLVLQAILFLLAASGLVALGLIGAGIALAVAAAARLALGTAIRAV